MIIKKCISEKISENIYIYIISLEINFFKQIYHLLLIYKDKNAEKIKIKTLKTKIFVNCAAISVDVILSV